MLCNFKRKTCKLNVYSIHTKIPDQWQRCWIRQLLFLFESLWAGLFGIRNGIYALLIVQNSGLFVHLNLVLKKRNMSNFWTNLDSRIYRLTMVCRWYNIDCMDLQLTVDPYKKHVLLESMDWLPKTHRVSWHISANQISTKHSPTAASWYEEWGLQFSQKSDIWYKNWSPFCLFLDFRNGAFWQLD